MPGAGEGLDQAFAGISALARNCRYPDCRHGSEPGCAVRAAIERNELKEDHVRSYLKLRKESEFHDMSSPDRRKKERAFGRLVQTYKKQKEGPSQR